MKFNRAGNRPFLGHDAYGYMKFLSEVIGARVAGSDEERAAAEYILHAFRSMGYEAELRRFDSPNGPSWNVVASREAVTEPCIVVGAHYDSVKDTPGANDNASGVGVLLETAIVLAAMDLPMPVLFAAFGSEEGSHAGSLHFVSQLSNLSDVAGMINLDAVGVDAEMEIGCYGEVDPWLANHCRSTAEFLGYMIGDCHFGGKSDYASFSDVGIPVACFARTDQPTAHTPEDNMNIISREGMAEIGTVLVQSLLNMPRRKRRA